MGSNCKKNQSFGTHCKEESSESKGKAKVIIFSQQWLSSLPLDWQLTKGKYRLFRKNSVYIYNNFFPPLYYGAIGPSENDQPISEKKCEARDGM